MGCKKFKDVVFIFENDGIYLNLNPKCEPQLGKRGLYNSIGRQKESTKISETILWILNLTQGTNSLLDIAIHSGINFKHIRKVADCLLSVDLLKKVED